MGKTKTLAEALHGPGLSLERDRLILFGSRAQGQARVDSDWDIAVVGPRKETMSHNRDVDLVLVPLDKFRRDEWYGTELAACLAFYAVPLSYELPEKGRIRFDEITKSATARAVRLWNQAEVSFANGSRPQVILRRKAATSALLASIYYKYGRACPARGVLIHYWGQLDDQSRRQMLQAVGIPHAVPPASIDPINDPV